MSQDFGYSPRVPGPRLQRERQQRRAKRRKLLSLALLVLLIAGAGAVVAAFVGDFKIIGRQPESKAGAKASESSRGTWLLIATVEADTSGSADWLSVVSWDRRAETGLMMYIPRSTYTEIPGHGLETIDKSLALGAEPLLITSISNLLGIHFDKYLRMSDQGVRVLFDELGGVTVDIEHKLTQAEPGGKVMVEFAEGRQRMDGKRVSEFLSFVNESGDEVARGARHALLWRTVFGLEAGQVTEAFKTSKDIFITDANAEEIGELFSALAAAGKTSITFETLPVRATGVDRGVQFYAPEREAIAKLVTDHLAGSRLTGSGSTGRRVEILNGNGRPGIGQQVSEQLVPKGFRVVLNQNAKSFDFAVTQIVVYSDSKRTLAVGKEVRELIGVGEVIVSRQKQTLVDVTIVVGKDYLDKAG